LVQHEPPHRRAPLIRRLMHFYWRFARGLTLGVRALVLDGEGRVFLVKHSYVDGWHLPGGGVEAGETMLEALARELYEEGNIELTAPPVLFGVYFHPAYSVRDHVALYVMRQFRQDVPPCAESRDHRARLLRTGCAAVRYHVGHARAHRRGDRWLARSRALVTGGPRLLRACHLC
jgi:8-oxo-dGTP pyrophosphatase MutT (NUDIX family)